MRRGLALLLALALMALSGCAIVNQAVSDSANTFQLYYLTDFVQDPEGSLGGDAIAAVPTVIDGGGDMEPLDLARAMVERLLEDPQETAGYYSAAPQGTTLLGLELDGSHLTVDLSGAYSSLSGIFLTLADYCMTLTLTQVPGVKVVSVTVEGQELAYRDHQNFRAQDVLMTTADDVVGTVEATLWFLGADGTTLVPEQRTLELYEGDSQAQVLVNALLEGPQNKELTSALPEGFGILSIWTEEDICYVNLPSSVCDAASGDASRFTIRALVDSLCSLDTVDGVQIRVDGESRARYGEVDISGILQPDQ